MAFERARIAVKTASVGTGFKVSIVKIRGGSSKMKFAVSPALATQFGWSDKDKLEVLIGTNEHHGIMRFRKNNSTGDAVVAFRKGPHDTKYVQIGLGHQPAFVDRAEAARWCQFEDVEDGWIEVILPRWADETAPRKTAHVAAQPAAAVLPRPLPKQSVTASIMGDPAPNRREIMDKIGSIKA